jgi:hypothetical protein
MDDLVEMLDAQYEAGRKIRLKKFWDEFFQKHFGVDSGLD